MRRPSLSQPNRHQFLDVSLANSFSASLTTTLLQHPPPAVQPAARRGEASTRVQLQKQRLEEQQHAADSLSKSIPGLKTSAAFFASLRTNLRLHISPPPSPLPTPSPSLTSSWTTLPPPSPSSTPLTPTDSVMDPLDTPSKPPRPTKTTKPLLTIPPPSPLLPTDPLAGLPELTTYPTTSSAEKVAALRLIADSVAQQRQTANRVLIFHPLHLALLVAVLAFGIRKGLAAGYDRVGIGMTVAGVVMAYLLGVRFVTQGYLGQAEGVGWGWLGDGEIGNGNGVVCEVFVTRFGEEVIGCAVVEWVSGESCKQRRKRAWRGEIRAWTVRLRYRGKGVGTALLEEVVREGKRRGAEGIEFAEDHANSFRVLPRFYNGVFDRKEWRAREALFDLLQSSPRGKRK